MPDMLQQMRRDWNSRAEHDALYWVYTVHGHLFENIHAYYEAGRDHALEMLSLGLSESGMSPSGKTILEIGCGVGRLFPGFAQSGFSGIWGADISPEMIERGTRWCPVPGALFLLVDGARLDGVADNSVDYCFSYNVFQHFPRPRLLWQNFEEVFRVLQPGGWFQVHFRGAYGFKQRSLRLLPPALRHHAHILYRAASLKWLRGQSILPEYDPGHEETWELGVAISPARLVQRLQRMGFADVKVTPDAGYQDGRRFWVTGRKGG